MGVGRVSPRWAFLEGLDVGKEGDPYLDRLRIIQTPWFGLYLHKIHRPDREPAPHDHPWWFTSMVLCGGYYEKIWPDKFNQRRTFIRHHRRFSVMSVSREAAHIITKVDGPLWTLVLTGPRVAEWGFWTAGQFTPWQRYLEKNDGE